VKLTYLAGLSFRSVSVWSQPPKGLARLILAEAKRSRLMRTAIHIAILVTANLLLVAGISVVNTESDLLAKLKKSDAYAARDAYVSEAGAQSEYPFSGDGPRVSRAPHRAAAKQMAVKKRKNAESQQGMKNAREKGAVYPRTYRPSLDLRYDD
jgi:hypothetical protein